MKIIDNKKKNMKINIELLIIFAFGAILYDVYFHWPTYPNAKIGKLIVMAIRYGSTALLLIYQMAIRKGNLKLPKVSVAIIIFAVFSLFETHLMGEDNLTLIKFKDLLIIIDLFLMCILPEKIKSVIFEYMLKIFSIIILPSLIYFILTRIFRINLPFRVLYSYLESKEIRMIRYEWRPLGLIIRTFSPYQNVIPRYCGIFDEAGVIGTLSAFFLAGSLYSNKINNKWKVLLVIEGIFSLSVAFYLLLVIIMIIYAYNHGFIRLVFLLLSLLCLFIIFINADLTKYPSLHHLQNRIDLSSILLVKNNRNSSLFDKQFDQFLRIKSYSFFFGHGVEASKDDSATGGSSSYKRVLYDHGFVGAFLYYSIFFLPFLNKQYRKTVLITFIIVFILSIYQRPYIKNHQIIILFYSALSHMNRDCAISHKRKVKII